MIEVDNTSPSIEPAMNTIYKILALITLFSDISGHGFGRGTRIAAYQQWYCLNRIFSIKYTKFPMLTYDCTKKRYSGGKIVAMRPGTTNCYMSIGLDDDRSHDIICTPSQEFYLPEYDAWIEAASLKVGDKLMSTFNHPRTITSVIFTPQPCNILIIEVNEPHTFCIGEYSVLVKNMVLPCITIGYAFPLGGGTAGGWLGALLGGTFTCGFGCLVGGTVIGYTIKYCMTDREQSYDFTFDEAKLGLLFQEKSEPQPDGTIRIPSQSPEKSQERVADNAPAKTIEEILQGAFPGEKTHGPSTIFEKPGTTYQHTEEDFDSTRPTEVRPISCGKAGKLPDGRWIVARWESDDGRPTLEIQGPGRSRIKIRYG